MPKKKKLVREATDQIDTEKYAKEIENKSANLGLDVLIRQLKYKVQPLS